MPSLKSSLRPSSRWMVKCQLCMYAARNRSGACARRADLVTQRGSNLLCWQRIVAVHPAPVIDDADAYDRKAAELAGMFRANFATLSAEAPERAERGAPPAR